MTSVGDPLLGQLIDGRYQITRRLARGGMATVYAALDTRLTRTVALKVMHVGLGDDAEFARKFDREARAAARLSHPNVVSVFDQGHDSGRPYIVMEYVDGHTLRDVLNADAPLPPLKALETIEPVLNALACAHEAGLVHRDVKPENVLISERGQVKVADFGLAKAITSQTSTATQGLLIGTVSYLPPELVVSGKADARSDVYSAGVVLFELLTGRKPHTGETPIQVAYAHVHADVPPPSSFPTAGPIPPYLDALVARATSRDATLRPHDAKIFGAQARRVRAALRAGLLDDPELTQDLSAVRRASAASPVDAADLEHTQLVDPGRHVPPPGAPTPGPSPTAPSSTASSNTAPVHPPSAPGAGSAPTSGSAWSPVSQPSPPTVRDAGPPGYPQQHLRQLSAERVNAQRERQGRRRRRGLLILLLVLMLTTCAALAGWYLTEGRFTSAPALDRLPESEAITIAERSGLQLATSTAYSESVSKGMVISTDPVAGSKILDGGTMTVVVSKGPERYAVPALVGLTRAAAVAALTKSNLALGTVRETWHETVRPGAVVAASKEAGLDLRRGSRIDLVVSKGPRPIPVASYLGQKASRAVAGLTKAGFAVKRTTSHSDSVPAGSVIAQDPRNGNGKRGDTVTLDVSLGPVMVEIPNVRRMSTAAASKVMKERGFKVSVQPVAVNYIGVGFVVTTKPGPTRQAPKGSTITLYVI